MYIQFKTLTYQNFLSSGNNPISINFNKNSTTLIHGKNGSGKSQNYEALFFALYGKPFRKIKKSELVNNTNKKKTLVTVEFNINNIEYKIERGIKPNIFNIHVDNEKIDNASSMIDYQKELEYTILKMTPETFKQVIVLGSSSYVPFMQLPVKGRNEIIEDLLDIQIFSKMVIVMKSRLSELKKKISDTGHSLDIISTTIDNLNDQYNDANQHNNNEVGVKIIAIKDDITKLNNNIIQLQELKTQFSFDPNKHQERVNAVTGIDKKINGNQFKIKAIVENLDFFKKDTCPTCTQSIEEEVKNTNILKLNKKHSILEEDNFEFNSLKDRLNEAIDNGNEKLVNLQKIDKKINEFVTKVSQLNLTLSDFEEHSIIDISHIEEKLKIKRKEFKILNDNYQLNLTDMEEFQVISNILNESGIKLNIIRKYLPLINEHIRKYLEILEFNASFAFDENFNEKIVVDGRNNITYYSLSEGQKMRIDLCVLFAFRDISRMKNSTSSNLLIFDEIGDSSLDEEGFEAFLRIIDDSTKSGSNVFIISHNEIMKDSDEIECSIEVRKEGPFSYLV